MMDLSGILSAPELPNNLPKGALWLSGEGAGSWFVITNFDGQTYSVNRYDPIGVVECAGVFSCQSNFDIHSPYKITYPSHCGKVTIEQNNQLIHFYSIEKTDDQ
jgi:hypothetical protein